MLYIICFISGYVLGVVTAPFGKTIWLKIKSLFGKKVQVEEKEVKKEETSKKKPAKKKKQG